MHKTILSAAAVTMLWSSAVASTSVKVGYGTIAGEFVFTHANSALGPTVLSNKTEKISAGVFTFGGAVMTPVTGRFSAGFEVGASTSGEWEIDHTKLSTPPVGTAFHPDAGDVTSYHISKFPILARGEASMAAGPGTVVVGVGLGAVVIGWQEVGTDVEYWDGTLGSDQPTMDSTHAMKYGEHITTLSGATTAFVFEIAPAFHYKLNAKSSIGFELPLQFVGETIIGGDREEYAATPPAYSSDPRHFQPEIKIGGLAWGANVVLTLGI